MEYKIALAVRVQRFLDKLEAKTRHRIERRLKRLKMDPVPSDAKCIGRQADQNVFRYRIGDFRALYTVSTPGLVVIVHKIDKRSRVYS